MKQFYFIVLLVFFLQFVITFSPTLTRASTDCNIVSVLRVGSKGADVLCLQEKLGIATDGSFGPLTRVAVLAFQSKNRLVSDGIVGPLSRAVLNTTSVSSIYPSGCTSSIGYSITTGIKCDSALKQVPPVATVNNGQSNLPVSSGGSNNSSATTNTTNTTTTTNPNLTNLDQFINTVVEVNRKAGTSEANLQIIADALRKSFTTNSVDSNNKRFQDLLASESKLGLKINNNQSLFAFNKIVTKALSFFGIIPTTAQASTSLPFGGALLVSFYCPVSANWMLTIEPLPPTFVGLLSYTPGTQGFASYNIPFTGYLLGEYIPPGACVIPPAITILTEGTITPMVGSSPL
jgi:peptidoglycan hydrolase-like protein with peptidoglycan-binding domain